MGTPYRQPHGLKWPQETPPRGEAAARGHVNLLSPTRHSNIRYMDPSEQQPTQSRPFTPTEAQREGVKRWLVERIAQRAAERFLAEEAERAKPPLPVDHAPPSSGQLTGS